MNERSNESTKGQQEKNHYTIVIHNTKYSFTSDDGPEHVDGIKQKLKRITAALSHHEPVMSGYAMKLALLLADDAVREERRRIQQEAALAKQETTLAEQLAPILRDLDRVVE